MAKTMAEIIREHQPTTGMSVASGVTCQCGYWNGEERAGVNRPPGFQGLIWHQGQELEAAGYGLVTDAKREAWDEGKDAVWTFMSNQDPRRERPTNPYRKASNDDQRRSG